MFFLKRKVTEPNFDKNYPHALDYTPMTWWRFQRLVMWAKKEVNKIGYPIYLVGSTLYKKNPRDLDIAIIIPLREYEKRYGKLPQRDEDYTLYLHKVLVMYDEYYFSCQDALNNEVHIDFKVCPDTWFVHKTKLLLAAPRKKRGLFK